MRDSEIISITARQVFTKRPNPGVEAVVTTVKGSGRAVCTGGVSVGTHETAFKYDSNGKWRGKGVGAVVETINREISPKMLGVDCSVQHVVDDALLSICSDAKAVFGGNAIAAVSAAALKAGANSLGLPLYRHIGGERAVTLPVPGLMAFGGSGRYGGGVSNPGIKPSYSFVCYDFNSFADASYAAWELAQFWREELLAHGIYLPEQLDVFGIIPADIFRDEESIWELMVKTINKAGYLNRIGLQVDAAGDSYYDRKIQKYRGLFTRSDLSAGELLEIYIKMTKNYPFVVIEDPFHEDDYEYHALLTKAVDIQVVGDDLFTTNAERLKKGAELDACNAVLLKVNQIGTITEALDMARVAKESGYGIMPCDSRGEGPDIADYCVGINAGSVRESAVGDVGNRFLEIEAELGKAARFAGKGGLKGERFK